MEQNTDKEGDKLVRGLCATLLGICIAYHDGSTASYTKCVDEFTQGKVLESHDL